MKEWIKETALKTVKTMAQTALATLTTVTLITEVDWLVIASAVGLSGIICVLMNVGNIELESTDNTESESEGA